MKVFEMLAYLRDESSTNAKESFVKENTECHEVLRYLCDNNIRTGLAKIHWANSYDPEDMFDADKLTVKLVDFFSKCGPDGSSGMKLSTMERCYLEGPHDPDWKWFVELIATHGSSSAFGVGRPTLAKAGIRIERFGCQLGVDFSEKHMRDFKKWRISEKIDGTRRLFIKTDKKVKCYSRSGKVDTTLGHICSDIESFLSDNKIYDCEIVDRQMYESKVASFEMRAKSVGLAARKSGDKSGLIAICFDYFDYENPYLTTLERTRNLKQELGIIHLKNIRMVNLYGRMDGYDPAKLSEIMEPILEAGGEGVMLQELSSMYKFERTSDLLKVKRLEEYKGIIESVKPGRTGTRLEGTMGTLMCRVKGCDQKVAVGTGFSDADRKMFWENREELIGARVELEAFSKTKDKHGQSSLCFPVFKRCLHELFEEV